MTLRKADETTVEAHLEDCVLLPKDARVLEGREPVEFEDEADPTREPVVRSPGQMIEEAAANKDQIIGPCRRTKNSLVENWQDWEQDSS